MSEIHLPHDHGGDAPLAVIQEKLQKRTGKVNPPRFPETLTKTR